MMEATFRACRTERSGRRRKRNLHWGAIVLVKEEGAYRNDWPIRRVSEAIESEDSRVRKAQLEIVRGYTKKKFLRPIKELVLLVPAPHWTHTVPLAREEDI